MANYYGDDLDNYSAATAVEIVVAVAAVKTADKISCSKALNVVPVMVEIRAQLAHVVRALIGDTDAHFSSLQTSQAI